MWANAGRGDIVARDVDRQPADIADGAHDGIDMGHQNVPANARQRHILAKGGAQDDVRIGSLGEGKDAPLQNIQ